MGKAPEPDTEQLRRLYEDENPSLSAIAARCDCSLTTVWRRLKAAGIATRPDGGAALYARHDFSGDQAEQAYLIGFRIGDLNVELHANAIVVKCTSTRDEQVTLFETYSSAMGTSIPMRQHLRVGSDNPSGCPWR